MENLDNNALIACTKGISEETSPVYNIYFEQLLPL